MVQSNEPIHQLELVHVKFFGRSKELTILERCLDRMMSGAGEAASQFVTITGYSGTGKSRLVDAFLARCTAVRDRETFYCVGKCEESRVQEPFSVLRDALHELFASLLESPPKAATTEAIAKEIRKAVGGEGAVLTNVIPGLSDLIGETTSSNTEDASTATDRLQFLFRQLLRAITKHVPIIMFCDDLQWVDASSLNILKWLVVDQKLKRFMLIGSYRINEVDQTHILQQELENIELKKAEAIPQIILENLSSTELNVLIAKILKLEPDDTLDLSSVVFEKTHGNVFFALQFLQALERERLLTFSFAEVRWIWVDSHRIRNDTSIADNVVDLIADKIKRLSPAVQDCLRVASFLSTTVSISVFTAIMEGLDETLNYDVQAKLEEATKEGFILRLSRKTMDAQYKFAHDRIQQAAYSLVPKGPQADRLHYEIGCQLLKLLDTIKDERQKEWISFLAPHQLQRGRSCIRDDVDLVNLAALNLESGMKAISLAAFIPASQFLSNGIAIMADIADAWDLHHDLQLALHQNLADVIWSTGSPTKSEDLVKEVVDHARTPEERYPAFLTLARSLGAQEKHKEAVDVEVRELMSLKVFPRSFRTVKALALLVKLKKRMKGVTKEHILKLPECTDPRIIAAMEFLRMLVRHATFYGDDILQVLAGTLSVKLLLKYGYHKSSAASLAQLGVFVQIVFGDAKEGQRLGELSSCLFTKMDLHDTMGELVLWSYLNPWRVPLNETLEPLLHNYNVGMKRGDVEMAFVCFTTYLVHGFIAGLCLEPLLADAKSHFETSQEYGINAIISSLRSIRQAMLNLAGRCVNPLVMTGEAMDEDEFLAMPYSAMGLYNFYLYKLQVCYLYGEIEVANDLLKKAKKHSKSAISFCEKSVLMYYEALIPLTLAMRTGSRTSKRRARSAINAVRKAVTVEHKGMNLSHKLMILDAGFLSLSSKKEELVQQAYEKAIKMATRTGFRQDAAVANLHSGLYCLNVRDDKYGASYHIGRSVELFEDWGAVGVSKHISRQFSRTVDLSGVSRLSSTNHQGRKRHTIRVSSHSSAGSSRLENSLRLSFWQ